MIVNLTEQEWVIFANAAGRAPYNEIAAVMQKVMVQLQQQTQPQVPKTNGHDTVEAANG